MITSAKFGSIMSSTIPHITIFSTESIAHINSATDIEERIFLSPKIPINIRLDLLKISGVVLIAFLKAVLSAFSPVALPYST